VGAPRRRTVRCLVSSRSQIHPLLYPTHHTDTQLLPADAAKRLASTSAGGYASGSDTDTSRVGRTKLKLKNKSSTTNTNSPKGSPTGSPRRDQTPVSRSRAASPVGGSRAQSPQPFPTLDEVKAAIPAEGVVIGDLVKLFKTRLGGRNGEFIQLVKGAGRQDTGTKRIVPKD